MYSSSSITQSVMSVIFTPETNLKSYISTILVGYCLLQILPSLQKSTIAYIFQIVYGLSSAGFTLVNSQEYKIPTDMRLFVQMTHT